MVAWFARLSARGRAGVVGGAIAAVLAVVAGVVVATGGDDPAPEVVATTTSTTEAEITTTTEPATGPVAPLTGLRMADASAATRPALAAKIDNLDVAGESAVPQAGLANADIVFEEIVEGNITRLVAIFHSQAPGDRVGPVRSARTTDIQILPQFGRTLLAWSGGNDGVTAAVRAAPSIIDMGHDRASSAYGRDRNRAAPHNLYVDAGRLYGLAPDEVTPPQPIFTYREPGEQVHASSTSGGGVDINWGSGIASSPVRWTWNPELKLYERSQNGRPHESETGPIVSQNVVVLVTEYGVSPADTRSPEAHTVGAGDALVFTGGQLVTGRWERPSAEVPATLLAADGAEIRLTPGQTWIELPRAGGATPR